MGKITRAAALSAVVFTAMASGPAAQAPELALGMIRPDGILTPFAVFDGKTWTAAWPEPQNEMVLDRMIEHVPSYWKQHQRQVPLAWHVVRPGQPVLQVNVLEHIVFGEHCGNQVGLLTDMPSRREVDSMSDARMLAADRPFSVEMPVALSEAAASAEWKNFLQAIHKEVARQEAAAIANWEGHSGRKARGAPASRSAIRLRTLYVHRTPELRTMFYEALRDYGTDSDGPGAGGSVLVATGWVSAAGEQPPVAVAERSSISGPNYIQGAPLRPLGVLSIDGSTFWVALMIGYESEAVTVIDFTGRPRKMLLSLIGGC